MKVIMKCVNIKLWDLLGCLHYILNAPRSNGKSKKKMPEFYTWTILLINQFGEIGEKQLLVFCFKGGQICPLMHVL